MKYFAALLTVFLCHNAMASKCLTDEAVLKEIRKKERRLSNLEKTLNTRQKEIEEKDRALQEEIEKVETLRKEVEKLQASVDSKNEAKVAKMVETFERMSPKNAAKIVKNLSDNLAVEAMTRISSPKLAKILSSMDEKRSSELTELLATGKKPTRKPAGSRKGKS